MGIAIAIIVLLALVSLFGTFLKSFFISVAIITPIVIIIFIIKRNIDRKRMEERLAVEREEQAKKEAKEKIFAERQRAMLERQKAERKKQQAEDEEHRRIEREKQQAEVEERIRIKDEKRQKFLEEQYKKFNDDINAIHKHKIVIAENAISNNKLSDYHSSELKISKPRKGMSIYKFSDFVVIDIETTGLKAGKDKIIQISAIRFEDFEPIETFTTYVNPNRPIPDEATAINHITDEMVVDAPEFGVIAKSLFDFVGKSNILGHNLEFDLRFLYKNGCDFMSEPKRKFYDTLEMARTKLKKYNENAYQKYELYSCDVYDYKLDTLCDYYKIYRNNSHNALSDCYATAKVFIKMLDDEYELEK